MIFTSILSSYPPERKTAFRQWKQQERIFIQVLLGFCLPCVIAYPGAIGKVMSDHKNNNLESVEQGWQRGTSDP
jgi:hypothetical protein